MTIFDILDQVIAKGGSDIHILPGNPVMLRINGVLEQIQGSPVLEQKDAEALIYPLLTQEQKDYFLVNKEMDLGYQHRDVGRFRINVYLAQGNIGAALRLIPSQIKTIDELNLPNAFNEMTKYQQGLVLLTGPTGEGKSTTLAAMIDEINATRQAHIITIEDPVEFIYSPKKSIISQREINHDTHGWDVALKSALREDPDVVLIGEMRDFETIAAAITIAETGHLVFATLHTSTAPQTLDRIIDVFPAHQQGQIRQQLAATIKAIASQRLLPTTSGGLQPATEIMFSTPAIRNLIREQKAFQIDTIIQMSSEQGMMLFENHLFELIQKGIISQEVALDHAFRREEMERMLDKV